MKRQSNYLTQITASIMIAVFTFSNSIIVTRELTYADRALYGIVTVVIAQGFLLVQGGLPGAINALGLNPLMNATIKEFILFSSKRIFLILILTFIAKNVYNLPEHIHLLATFSFIFLAIFQWISNGLQKLVTNFEYAFIRTLSSAIFFVCLIALTQTSKISAFSSLIAWFTSIFISLTYSLIRLVQRKSHVPKSESTLKDLNRYARKGFIAHISFQDLFRLETFLVPLLLEKSQVALYFAVLGLSQWPKVIIDGISASSVQQYVQIDKLKSFEIGIKIMYRTIFSLTFLVIVSAPLQIFFFTNFIGDLYPNSFSLYFLLLFASIFNYSRRLLLDSLRANSEAGALKATKIEFVIGCIMSLSVAILFVIHNLNIWAIALLILSVIGFLVNVILGNHFLSEK